jgi:hypothetical protein
VELGPFLSDLHYLPTINRFIHQHIQQSGFSAQKVWKVTLYLP